MRSGSGNLGRACVLVSLVAMAVVASSAEVHAADGAGGTVRVSSLDLSRMAVGWGQAKPDRSIGGRPLSIRGQAYDHGIGTHAPSRLRIQLDGKAVRFRSVVGIDDTAEGHGRVRFLVLADHRVVWDSGDIWGSTPARPVELDVRDVKVLELRVEDGGDGSGYDHADWAEATLVMQPDAPAPTTLEPYDVLSVAGTSFPLRFLVGDDGTLYQLPLGARREDFRHESSDLAYPQGGYGFVFEPALQVVHADGNRSTLLKYVTSHRESQTDGAELLRIHLHDAVFPLEVMLCFRAYPQWGLVEQWVEITHHEAGAITLERMASASLLLPADREFWPSDNTDALRRVMMQWDYSYFFPPIAICSHVTHAGNRPLHFATSVAMSARFGMDIDVTALSAEDRAICRSAIETYKKIREVVHLGDLYRVERPHDAARGVQNYVSADRSRVIVFVFQLRDGVLDPVKPQGLDAQRQYRLTEIHCAQGRTPLADEGKTIRGAEIMQQGIRPSIATALQATLIELTAVE